MKKLSGRLRGLVTLSALLFTVIGLKAQSYTDSLAHDDQDILSSIAPYDADTRLAILNVSEYPQVLVKLERIQARSSQSFQDMVSAYPREEQEKLYEISRFPDLVNQLAGNRKMSAEEVRPYVKDFPAATQTRMLQTYNTHYDDIVRMNTLYNSSQDALQKVITSYPTEIQNDFRKVVGMPEVINLLTENINLTVSLGEEYKADPEGIRRQLDIMNGQLEQKNAQDLAAYKTEVENDPKLQGEMKKAATDFSASYDQPDNPAYVTNNYYDNYPYPYWFSYPYWYTTPIWYPRPIYYHTGFYYGPGGGIVVVGLPSRMYSTWFFGRGYRHYPYLYNRYNTYYNFHRGNVYRGFNNTAGDHFNHTYNSRRGRGYNNAGNNYGQRTGRPTTNVQSHANQNTRNSQMTVRPNNFNNQGMQRFHATTYHQMGWQNMNGVRSGGSNPRPSGTLQHNYGGSRSSGGSRPSGGSHSGGGGHAGGGHSGGGGRGR